MGDDGRIKLENRYRNEEITLKLGDPVKIGDRRGTIEKISQDTHSTKIEIEWYM